MLNAKLVIVGGGDAKVSEIQLQLPTTIGRSREAKVKLPHPLVSRKHCEVFERDGQLFVRDLGSLNGTYVDSQKIESEQALEPNHLLTLGTVTFRAIYESVSADSKSLPEQPADTSASSERPRDRVKIPAEEKPVRRQSPQSEVETENDRAASDTDTSLPTLGQIDFQENGDPSKNLPATASSIFVNSDVPSSNGSVSLSEISKLPGAPEQLSFVGGVHLEDNKATQLVPATNSLPKIATDANTPVREKSAKRRPR